MINKHRSPVIKILQIPPGKSQHTEKTHDNNCQLFPLKHLPLLDVEAFTQKEVTQGRLSTNQNWLTLNT